MGKTIFIPMTRMNLLGCLDFFVLTPPKFLKARKYYNDFTDIFPSHLTAFTDFVIPNYLPDIEKGFNFLTIVEAELASIAGIKAIFFDESKIEALSWKPKDTPKDTAILLPNPLVSECIKKIYVLNENERADLLEDPLFKEREYKIPVEIFKTDAKYTEFFNLMSERKKGLGKVKGYQSKAYDTLFKEVGGLVMLSQAQQEQNWGGSSLFTISVIELLDNFLSRFINLDSFNFDTLGMFIEPSDTSAQRLHEITKILNSRSAKKKSDILFDDFSTVDTNDISTEIQIDQYCFESLIDECILGHPKKISTTSVIRNVIKRISNIPDSKIFSNEKTRVIKGLELIQEIMTGRQQLTSMFSSKTKWARSIRAATLFCLRPEPKEMIGWTKEHKPAKADQEDLLRAAFLCGIYHGFSRLPWGIKSKWAPLIKIPVNNNLKKPRRKKLNREIKTKWIHKNNFIHGAYKIIYTKNQTIRLNTQVNVNLLIQSFCDLIYPMVLEDKLGIKEKSVLSIMANELGLKERIINIVSNRNIEAGKTIIRGDGDIVIHSDWDYKKIIERVSDSDNISLPDEIILIIAHYLGYRTHELYNDSEIDLDKDYNIGILHQIDNHLEKILSDIKSAANIYPALREIHIDGVMLGHDLVNLLRIKSLNNKIKKELQSALLYLVLEDDIISEDVDPVFGMIDDWIWLGHIAQKICTLKKGALKDNVELLMKGTALNQKISKEFGEHFVTALINRIEMAFKIRRWVTG